MALVTLLDDHLPNHQSFNGFTRWNTTVTVNRPHLGTGPLHRPGFKSTKHAGMMWKNARSHMGISKNRSIPKWMVYTWKTLLIGGTPIFGNTHIGITCWKNTTKKTHPKSSMLYLWQHNTLLAIAQSRFEIIWSCLHQSNGSWCMTWSKVQ